MTEDRGVWVYAVARGIEEDWLAGISGMDGQPVRVVTAAGLAAAVTTVSLAEFGADALRRHLEDMAWLESAARAHHQVIESVAAHGPVVPLRLATVYRDDPGVAELLAGRQSDFAGALDRVTGRAEWGVKVFPASQPEPAPAEPAGTGAAGSRAAGAGAAYLSRRRQQLSAAEQSRQAAAASAEHIHAMLARLAAAAQMRAPQAPQLSGLREQMILNGAYLVDENRSEAFTAAAADLAAGCSGVRVELTGPWPPYSFAAVPEPQAAG
ncbi:MAG: GvpL/GvpF family gas vesicle protein [Actinobacteria bacterium]|nr:GvpL/GvpF family gas vesicle protein [Actinomycetota bacterium]